MADCNFRILSLDGGGAKGFYTLGVLREIEAVVGKPLCEHFDLIYGTSTGSIIASLLGIGKTVDEIIELYDAHVVKIVSRFWPWTKSTALCELTAEVFGDLRFDAFKTDMGIVTTRWVEERPMIFKTSVAQAHGSKATFEPGFGCTIGDAVQASCSAFPFFCRKEVTTSAGETILLMDGGYCANNPTLYALSDASESLGIDLSTVRLVSIGVGEYPPVTKWFDPMWWVSRLPTVRLLQKTMEINAQSMEQLRSVLFNAVKAVRINEAFKEPSMATDLFERNEKKLNVLRQRGKQSFGKREAEIRAVLL
jgi:predicted acylesterase/phospholipase RssA